jgi:nitrilase
VTELALPVLAAARREDRDSRHVLSVAGAQLGGLWLNPKARVSRLIAAAELAAAEGADLVAFPETYLNGYPFWMTRTASGARFGDADQKACYAYYLDTAIEVGGPTTRELETLARDLAITLMVGITERGSRMGTGSTYCTLLTITPAEGVAGVHRKLVPTYDERLVWAHGDGAGLRTYPVGPALVGGLNCWENWMPQARNVLYAEGETLHVSTWPGSPALTRDITRFAAMEGRSFGLAVGGVLTAADIPDDFPLLQELRENSATDPFTGGSAVAAPDGSWLIEPVTGEGLILADLDLRAVQRERLTFDPTGHYSRPDVFSTRVDRRRHQPVTVTGGTDAAAASDGEDPP